MSKSRILLAAAVAALAVMLIGGAGSAAAQTSGTPLTQTVAMTGTAKNGKKFNGTYTIDRFTAHAAASCTPSARSRAGCKGRRVTQEQRPHPGRARAPAAQARADPADRRTPARSST